jgi:ABC-2 type transport system permease protein
MFKRVWAISGKEMRELLRDPVYLAMALIVPVLVLFIMGTGLTLDVKNIPMAIYDHNRSAASRDYISSFTNSEYFYLVGMIDDEAQAKKWMAQGKIRLCIEIPENFAERLSANRPVSVRVSVDGTFPSRAEVIIGYVEAINYQTNSKLIADYIRETGQNMALPQVIPVAVAWYNPTLDSKNFLIPALIAAILMFYSSLLSALIIVREKEIGTIYNFYCSPVKAWEVVIGKAAPYIIVTYVAYLLLFLVSILFFEVKFSGSFIALSLSALLFLICTVGYGLLVSMLAPTQISAMFIVLITTLVPSFFYSGFFAPITSQSAIGQFISIFIPSTYFIEIIRGIYLKGASFDVIYHSLLALLLFTVILYGLAIAFFRKKVS